MNRKLLAVLLLVAACMTVFAGGKKEPAKADEVVLTVWESTNGPDEFIRQAGAAFTATHPNVKINYVNVELGDACGQIALDGPAGVGADVFAAPHDKLGELVSAGSVLPTANAAAVKNAVLGACSTALTYDGVMYGYPVSAETYALFYNKAMIKENELPKTWDDLAAWSKAFNAANPGKYGFIMDVGNAYYTIVFSSANGNRLFGESGTDTSTTYLNSADSVKGMTFFQSLRSALDVPAADLTTSFADAAFAAGSAAMHITGLWNVVPFENAGIDFGVAALPALPGDTKPASSFSGTRAMFVSAYTDHPAEANEFAEFLISEEMQKLRFDLTGAMPSINVEVSSKYMPGFLAQLDYAFPMPSIPEMGTFWEAMNNASKNIWDGVDVKAELDACDATILGK
ncbi:MAG: maltose ABC transporter substrate-binding protein [Treponemataceae bacterium]|nr:maltose ABC transporter substrate-binding protein [Treponemataceae bacterium]